MAVADGAFRDQIPDIRQVFQSDVVGDGQLCVELVVALGDSDIVVFPEGVGLFKMNIVVEEKLVASLFFFAGQRFVNGSVRIYVAAVTL